MKEIALTKDASEVEYKKMVKHVTFKSGADVKSVCAELTGRLEAQGWSSDGADMVQPTSSILKQSGTKRR